MAVTTPPVNLALTSGGTIAWTAANATGHRVRNEPGYQVLILVRTGTLATVATVGAQLINRPGDEKFPPMSVNNQAVNVGASALAILPPFPPAYRTVDSHLVVNFSQVTDVQIAALAIKVA